MKKSFPFIPRCTIIIYNVVYTTFSGASLSFGKSLLYGNGDTNLLCLKSFKGAV
jgi:hypothetical protein